MKKPIVNSNHYLALAVSCSIFLCSILAFVFVYYQIGLQIGNTDAAYIQMDQARMQESQAQQVISTLSNTQNERNLLSSFFVPDNQTVAFITQIEAVGSEAGKATVTIASISDDDLSNAAVGATGNIYAHIDIQGTWSDAMRALHLLESLPYGESINNLRVTPISSKDWNIEFDLTALLIHE